MIAVRRPGQPIRVLWRREDEFGHEPVGTAMHVELTAELDAGGRIADYATEIWSGSHTAGAARLPAGRDRARAARAAAARRAAQPAGRRALLRRHPQRHPVVRHPRASG